MNTLDPRFRGDDGTLVHASSISNQSWKKSATKNELPRALMAREGFSLVPHSATSSGSIRTSNRAKQDFPVR